MCVPRYCMRKQTILDFGYYQIFPFEVAQRTVERDPRLHKVSYDYLVFFMQRGEQPRLYRNIQVLYAILLSMLLTTIAVLTRKAGYWVLQSAILKALTLCLPNCHGCTP